MKKTELCRAVFYLKESEVAFIPDQEEVFVHTGSTVVAYHNIPDGRGGAPYKPRVADCLQLIRRAMGGKAPTANEAAREKKAKVKRG